MSGVAARIDAATLILYIGGGIFDKDLPELLDAIKLRQEFKRKGALDLVRKVYGPGFDIQVVPASPPASTGTQQPVTKRVAVSPADIGDLAREASAASRLGEVHLLLDYTDRNGDRTRRAVRDPVSLTPSNYSDAVMYFNALDVEKDEMRKFRLDRINRLERCE